MPTKTTSLTGTTVRNRYTSGHKEGAGAGKRWYVGRNGYYDYISYFKSTSLDHASSWWDEVGKIVKAELTVTVDDGFGTEGDTMPKGDPKVYLRRLKDSWSEDSHSTWNDGDWTSSAGDSTRSKTLYPTRGGNEQVTVDVTAWLEDWAPKRVKTSTGGNSRQMTMHGFGLFGVTDSNKNWAVFSDDDPETGKRPFITLTFEYGLTTPDTPQYNMAPVGSVASVASFQGSFTDNQNTDFLAKSHVQVYEGGQPKSGTCGTDNIIHVTNHGYQNGTEVWFTSLTGGAGLSANQPYWVYRIGSSTFKVRSDKPTGSIVNITNDYSALSVGTPFYSQTHPEGDAAKMAALFDHIPDFSKPLVRNTNYKWRARVIDNDGSTSVWSSLLTFSVFNTDPDAPGGLYPNGNSVDSLANVDFGGLFNDIDGEDWQIAAQVQLSAYPEGDPRWLEDEFILWNTGKVYGTYPDGWSIGYGGSGLTHGTYHWRARVWDNHHGVSAWSYSTVVVAQDFVLEPNASTSAIQMRPRAPWRIVIRDMYLPDGVTKTTGRGPGRVVAVIEDAMNVGASLLYNSPGEAHWTLGPNHPQTAVIEPKQTHYSIEFHTGEAWREVFAGLVWNVDATDRDNVFYGIDYLALLDRSVDTRYKSSNADTDYSNGGSKYSAKTIRTIVVNQLQQAQKRANSPVGFIEVGNIDAMNETVTVYSTYQPTLNFVGGLLDSHRAGKGISTRISCQKTSSGGYVWTVQDNPGVLRSNLRLRYGEMVQGYRIKPFGDDWATRVDAMGRDKDGIKVRYSSKSAPGIDEKVWGRYDYPTFIDGISDGNDLDRRTLQMVTGLSRLGKQVGIGLRSGVLQPRDGYDLMDRFPVEVVHGAIDTSRFGHDGEWVCVGITWQALQRGDLNTTLTLVPKETGSDPSNDLLVAHEISGQAEWQVGWDDPNPLKVTSRYWLNQSTGKVYSRVEGTIKATPITGTV